MATLNVSEMSDNVTMVPPNGGGRRALPPNFIDLKNADTAKKMIIPIVYVAIMMVLGLIGNALVVYIYGFKWRKTPEKCFITTLAIFDLVNCVITMPTEIATLVSFYRFTSHSFCKISRFSTFWMNNSSVVLLFAIAVDRFIKICLPNKVSFNYQKAQITCVCSTLVGLAVSWPSLIIYGIMTIPITKDITMTFCNVADGMKNSSYTIGFYIYLWVAFLAIALVMIILYGLIGIRIWLQKSKGDKRKDSLKASLRSSKSGSHSNEKEVSLISIKPKVEVENTQSVELSDDAFDSGSSGEPKRDGVVISPPVKPEPKTSTRSRLKSMTKVHISKSGLQAGKATAMLFTITMVYIISFLPYLVITIMRTAYGDTWYPSLSLSSQVAVNLFLRSYLISNTGNAIVYGFCNLTFRRECAKIFTRLFCCKK
ncbi:hypothetical protein SNE40_021625 [Patella caerulea]|uniref:G-protein coupled receptors family 1 profile domain-containing protein n=1 Tax=Patella caerulea TaxID=87958 RepID=A0AAN8G4H6_PATCE